MNSTTERDVVDRLERLFVLDDAVPKRPTAGGAGNSFWSGVALTSVAALSLYLVSQNVPTIEKIWKQTTHAAATSVTAVVPPSLVNGLSATRTTLTGVVDPESMTAAYYLSTVLHNSGSSNQEARMQIVLPAGAAVTRATLWVNGQAQEAAFTDNQTAQAAFDWVTQARRDPLLVKQIDARTIQVTASPVVPGGDGMKIRIGITAPVRLLRTGEAAAELPTIGQRNFGDGRYDVHIESTNAIFTENQSAVSQTGPNYMLRLNENSLESKLPAITLARHGSEATFATRATHSMSGGYVVAKPATDSDVGKPILELSLQTKKPEGRIFQSAEAATRLSTLWAKNEIQRFVDAGDTAQAIQIAHVYRLVSPVSSAVVLERDSDYERFSLNRNQWSSMNHAQKRVRTVRGTLARTAGRRSEKDSSGPTPLASAAPVLKAATGAGAGGDAFGDGSEFEASNQAPTMIAAAPMPELRGATNGTIGPQVNDDKSAPSVDGLSPGRLSDAPPLLAASTSPVAVMLLAIPLLLLGVLTWAPVAMLFGRAAKRLVCRQTGSAKLFLLGAAWLGLALTVPIVSQVLAVAIGFLLLRGRQRKSSTRAFR